jgi:secondary thiamine-phosphate synthase enzyme
LAVTIIPLIERFAVSTERRIELVDVTGNVRAALGRLRGKSGICVVYVPHTTAAVTVNENADPSVGMDINSVLSRLVPVRADYAHEEGNADAHAKAALVGSSVTLMVEDGELVLGTWQGVFFCEFDGPRQRQVMVKTMVEKDA